MHNTKKSIDFFYDIRTICTILAMKSPYFKHFRPKNLLISDFLPTFALDHRHHVSEETPV